jgi:hypothetical protein
LASEVSRELKMVRKTVAVATVGMTYGKKNTMRKKVVPWRFWKRI